MLRYFLRRLVGLVVVLFGVAVMAFMLTHVVPGNPATLLAGPRANASELRTVEAQYGLTGSLPSQFFHYLWSLLHGNLGFSLTTG